MGKNRTYDLLAVLKDAGAITASAAGTVSSAAAVFDTQGDTNSIAGFNRPADAELHFSVLVDISAVDIVSNDESYWIMIQGSPDAAFTAAGVAELCAIHVGAKETKLSDSDKDDVVGRYIFSGSNERVGTVYRYLRAYIVVAGTTPSINATIRLVQRLAL